LLQNKNCNLAPTHNWQTCCIGQVSN
jgi:hypothetical protein